MKIIKREKYIDKLRCVMGTPDIKVITGIRRSGKSKLLELFIKDIKKNVKKANIIHLNFNLAKYEKLKDYHLLNEYIENSYKKNCKNFVFIDEVQMCPNFELTINSLHEEGKYDIYLTGSNAFLMSSDLATLFTGRTFEIKVFPFSFIEFKKYYSLKNNYTAFDRYLREGGMPGSYLYNTENEKSEYLNEVFNALIVRDIYTKYNIKNKILIDKIVEYLMDNISNQTSIRNIANILINNKEKVNHKTVGSYVKYLCDAFLFYKINRYDIRGKKYLSTNEKYYLCDHTFRYAKLKKRNVDFGRVLENIVAIELMRRGFEIFVGVLYKKEVDFIATSGEKKIYIQVADNISDTKTFMREVTPLLDIKDAYQKIIIARTRTEEYDYNGIKIIDIADWLSSE